MNTGATVFRDEVPWYWVRESRLLIVLVASWYSIIVPITDVSSLVGYIARVAILLFGLALLSKKVIGVLLSNRIQVGFPLFAAAVSVLFLGKTLLLGEVGKFVDFVAFFGGICGFFLLSERYPLGAGDIFTFVTIALGAGIVLEVTGGPGTRGEFGLIPFTGENWKVLIKSPHFTGWGGMLMLFASLLLVNERGWRLRYLTLFAVAWYLVVFSGSRSSIAASLAIVVLWFSGTLRRVIMRRRYIGVSLTLVAGLSMYLGPVLIFQSLRAEGFLGTLLKISPGQEDVTAGRLLTWLYHLELFFENLWTGAPSSMVTEAGENLSRELVGSNESFYTKVLAKHGVLGVLFHTIFLVFSWYALKKEAYAAYVLSVVFAIVTAASGVFGSTYYIYSIIGYWSYFSIVNSTPKSTRK